MGVPMGVWCCNVQKHHKNDSHDPWWTTETGPRFFLAPCVNPDQFLSKNFKKNQKYQFWVYVWLFARGLTLGTPQHPLGFSRGENPWNKKIQRDWSSSKKREVPAPHISSLMLQALWEKSIPSDLVSYTNGLCAPAPEAGAQSPPTRNKMYIVLFWLIHSAPFWSHHPHTSVPTSQALHSQLLLSRPHHADQLDNDAEDVQAPSFPSTSPYWQYLWTQAVCVGMCVCLVCGMKFVIG